MGLRMRVNMYGEELAADIRVGHTPNELRERLRAEAWAEIYDNPSSSEDEDDVASTSHQVRRSSESSAPDGLPESEDGTGKRRRALPQPTCRLKDVTEARKIIPMTPTSPQAQALLPALFPCSRVEEKRPSTLPSATTSHPMKRKRSPESPPMDNPSTASTAVQDHQAVKKQRCKQ